MAESVTKTRSYDDCNGRRSVTGLHGSLKGKEQKCNWGHGNETSRHISVMGAWLHVLLNCMKVFMGIKREIQNNYQPVCERVTTSVLY